MRGSNNGICNQVRERLRWHFHAAVPQVAPRTLLYYVTQRVAGHHLPNSAQPLGSDNNGLSALSIRHPHARISTRPLSFSPSRLAGGAACVWDGKEAEGRGSRCYTAQDSIQPNRNAGQTKRVRGDRQRRWARPPNFGAAKLAFKAGFPQCLGCLIPSSARCNEDSVKLCVCGCAAPFSKRSNRFCERWAEKKKKKDRRHSGSRNREGRVNA